MLPVPALCDVNVLLALVTFDKAFRGLPGLICDVLEPHRTPG